MIKKTTDLYGFNFEAFILMNNHFHAMLSTPKKNLSEGMRYFMTESSRKIARKSCRINRIYGARYGRTLINSEIHYAIALKYLYRNPIKANLVSNINSFPYHSLNKLNPLSTLVKQNIHGFSASVPSVEDDFIDWINQEFPEHIDVLINKQLRKSVFGTLKLAGSRNKIDLTKLLGKEL